MKKNKQNQEKRFSINRKSTEEKINKRYLQNHRENEKDIRHAVIIIAIIMLFFGMARIHSFYFHGYTTFTIIGFPDCVLGPIMVFLSGTLYLTHCLDKVQRIKKLSIITTLIVWLYVFLNFFFLNLFVFPNSVWIILIAIIFMIVKVIKRSDYP